MTFVQHGAMAGLVTAYLGGPWELCVAIGIIGTLPDILPVIGTDYDALYAKYHSWNNNWLAYLWPSALHILIDKFWHKPTGGWYPWGYIVEPVVWVAEILLVWRFGFG